MKHTKNMIVKESAESRELGLYADNERDIYFDYIIPAVRNLAKYHKRGKFDTVKAIEREIRKQRLAELRSAC